MSSSPVVRPEKKRRRSPKIRNPVAIKELRGRMRGRRAFVILTIYLLIMSGLVLLIFGGFAASGSTGLNQRLMGKYVFAVVVAVQIFLVLIIGPSLTAGAISGEKERQTYDLLRTTLLSSRTIVAGKLLSALSYVFLLVIASIPIQSIAFFLGGISLSEVVISQAVILVCAIAYSMIGLFLSTVARNTLAASVATYAIVIFLTAGLPVLAGGIAILTESIRYGPLGLGDLSQVFLNYLLLLLAGLNLPASLVVSDIFLLENGSLFGYRDTISTYSVFMFSPWYLSILFYSLLALLLFSLTVRRVRRVSG